MITQNCKYNYYASPSVHITEHNFSSWDEIKQLFDTKIIKEISGHKNGIIVTTKTSFLIGTNNRPLSEAGTYICKYSPDMIKNLFGLSCGLDDIFNSHIGRKCESGEQAAVWFMAKILGNKNE